jgi:hypothetical protein
LGSKSYEIVCLPDGFFQGIFEEEDEKGEGTEGGPDEGTDNENLDEGFGKHGFIRVLGGFSS